MTQEELETVLKSFNIPVAYNEFQSTGGSPAPNPPFIVYFFKKDSDIKADDKNYVSIRNYGVKLCTSSKDIEKESLIENTFDSMNIPFYKTELWNETSKNYEIEYDVQLIRG